MERSKSAPLPRPLRLMISRLSSKTVMPVPSNVTRCGSLEDLNLKNTEDDIVATLDSKPIKSLVTGRVPIGNWDRSVDVSE